MHFSIGALSRFHIRIKSWPRLIGSDVSYILFPKARRVAADHKNFRLIDNESTAPICCVSKNRQLFAFKQKHQTRYKRCSYFSTFRHLPMVNPLACRNVFCKSKNHPLLLTPYYPFCRWKGKSFAFLPTSCYHHFADGPKSLWEWMQDAQFGTFWDILQPSFVANLMIFFFKPMIYFLCRWTKRPLGAHAKCPVWDPCKPPSLPILPHSSTAMAGWYVSITMFLSVFL